MIILTSRGKKSRNMASFCGNDTIDPYPLPCEGKLTKLLCISKERFERLSLTAQELLNKRH
ncbi:MAG: hypothetical protein WC574_06645, partial [Candidatus Omnitrophota bacterium]